MTKTKNTVEYAVWICGATGTTPLPWQSPEAFVQPIITTQINVLQPSAVLRVPYFVI